VHRLRSSASLLAFALILGGAAGCAGGRDTIRIGLAGPFSEERGRSMLLSAQMAVREINARGGVRGRRLELVVRDDSARPARAVLVAGALRDDRSVVAVVGHLTSATTLVAAATYNSGSDPIVNITPSASTPELSGIGRYTFRVCASDSLHGVALARWAYSRLNAHAVEVLYLNDEYGRGVANAFGAEFLRLGGTVIDRDPFLTGSTDFSAYLDRMGAQARAGAIVVGGPRTSGTLILRQARERGITIPLLGADALSGIQGEGAVAEGVFLSSNYLPDIDTPANVAFVRAYGQANGGALPDHRGAGAYDAVHLIAEAVRDAGVSRRGVRDAIAQLGGVRAAYVGVTGRIAFDRNGDVPGKQVLVGVVRGGRLVTAEGQ